MVTSLQKSEQVFDEEKQMIRIAGTWLESPLEVPVAGSGILGMNQNCHDSGNDGYARLFNFGKWKGFRLFTPDAFLKKFIAT